MASKPNKLGTPNSKLFATDDTEGDAVDSPRKAVRNYMKSSIVFDDYPGKADVIRRPRSSESDASSVETASSDGDGVNRNWSAGTASPGLPSSPTPSPSAPPATPVGAAGSTNRPNSASAGRARVPPGGHSQMKFW